MMTKKAAPPVPKGIDDALAADLQPRVADTTEEAEILDEAAQIAGNSPRPKSEVLSDWKRTAISLQKALLEVDEDLLLFRKSGTLLTPTEDDPDSLRCPDLAVLRLLLALRVDFGQWKKTKDSDEQWISKSPPSGVIEAMLRAPDLFGEVIRPLRRHVAAPTILPSGEITGEPGYYPEAEVYYSGRIGLGDLNLTVEEATKILEEPLQDFPFEDESDLANALAVSITWVGYDLFLGNAPMNVPVAPKEGSGKSLLIEVPALLVLGRIPMSVEYSENPEEFSKTIFSGMLTSPQAIMIDNIANLFDSPKLCSILALEETSTRKLGGNTVVTVRNDACFFANGNNIELTGELMRRSYLTRINANVEDPEERTGFKIPDLKQWAKEPKNQERYVAAILVIIQAWQRAGSPRFTARRLGSFVDWCEVIGGILEFIGHGSFLGNKDHFKANSDPEREMWRDFVREWWKHYKHTEVTTRNLYDVVILNDPRVGVEAFYNHRDSPLIALGSGVGPNSTKSQTTKLGTLLRKKVGQVFDVRLPGGVSSLKIERVEGNLSRSRYHLRPMPNSIELPQSPEEVATDGVLF